VAAVLYVLSGVYVVNPGEVAVERLFGRVVRESVGEGLRYALPWPFTRVDRVNLAEVHREEIGFTLPEHRGLHPAGAKVLALTGDENIVEVELVIQYRAADPVRALFAVGTRPYLLINDTVRAAVTRVVGSLPIDTILTVGKEDVQRLVREDAQARLDAYDSGLRLVTVNVQKLYPPDEVADAFRDVASASEDRARVISQAQGVRNSVVPEARGEAERLAREAEAYRVEVTSRARGEAASFLALMREYRQAGAEVTRQRLYTETMEKVLPRVKKYVVGTPEAGKVQLRVLESRPNAVR
jgi:membrane protease subunit HflK